MCESSFFRISFCTVGFGSVCLLFGVYRFSKGLLAYINIIMKYAHLFLIAIVLG